MGIKELDWSGDDKQRKVYSDNKEYLVGIEEK